MTLDTKILEFGSFLAQLYISECFGSKTVQALESHQKTKETYFSQWTPSGEAPVGSGSLSDSYFKSNLLLSLAGYYETPCTLSATTLFWF